MVYCSERIHVKISKGGKLTGQRESGWGGGVGKRAERPGELTDSASFSPQQGVAALKKHGQPAKLSQALVCRLLLGPHRMQHLHG